MKPEPKFIIIDLKEETAEYVDGLPKDQWLTHSRFENGSPSEVVDQAMQDHLHEEHCEGSEPIYGNDEDSSGFPLNRRWLDSEREGMSPYDIFYLEVIHRVEVAVSEIKDDYMSGEYFFDEDSHVLKLQVTLFPKESS